MYITTNWGYGTIRNIMTILDYRFRSKDNSKPDIQIHKWIITKEIINPVISGDREPSVS
jgi:hypothetical protein